MANSYKEVFDADDKFEYIRQWELECGKVEKTPEQIKADELDLKEWEASFKTADDLAWEEACRADEEAWKNGQAKLIEQITEARDKASAKIQAEKVEQVAEETQSTLEMYKSVLSNFNLHCELSLLYENLVYIYKDDSYLGAFDLTTGEITSYGLDLPLETMNQIVEGVNNYLTSQTEKISA